MFRIAPVVLFATSLSCLATAQAADQAPQKNPIKQAPDNGAVKVDPIEEPIADGTVLKDGKVVGAPSDQAKPLGTAWLKMSVNGLTVEAHVHSSEPAFMGVVGLSLTKDLTYSYGLPPLLTGAVVMAFGATETEDLGLRAPLSFLPSESITLFGQALVIDEKGLWSSNVVGLTIGATSAAIN
jgi:hypothetical protein